MVKIQTSFQQPQMIGFQDVSAKPTNIDAEDLESAQRMDAIRQKMEIFRSSQLETTRNFNYIDKVSNNIKGLTENLENDVNQAKKELEIIKKSDENIDRLLEQIKCDINETDTIVQNIERNSEISSAVPEGVVQIGEKLSSEMQLDLVELKGIASQLKAFEIQNNQILENISNVSERTSQGLDRITQDLKCAHAGVADLEDQNALNVKNIAEIKALVNTTQDTLVEIEQIARENQELINQIQVISEDVKNIADEVDRKSGEIEQSYNSIDQELNTIEREQIEIKKQIDTNIRLLEDVNLNSIKTNFSNQFFTDVKEKISMVFENREMLFERVNDIRAQAFDCLGKGSAWLSTQAEDLTLGVVRKASTSAFKVLFDHPLGYLAAAILAYQGMKLFVDNSLSFLAVGGIGILCIIKNRKYFAKMMEFGS